MIKLSFVNCFLETVKNLGQLYFHTEDFAEYEKLFLELVPLYESLMKIEPKTLEDVLFVLYNGVNFSGGWVKRTIIHLDKTQNYPLAAESLENASKILHSTYQKLLDLKKLVVNRTKQHEQDPSLHDVPPPQLSATLDDYQVQIKNGLIEVESLEAELAYRMKSQTSAQVLQKYNSIITTIDEILDTHLFESQARENLRKLSTENVNESAEMNDEQREKHVISLQEKKVDMLFKKASIQFDDLKDVWAADTTMNDCLDLALTLHEPLSPYLVSVYQKAIEIFRNTPNKARIPMLEVDLKRAKDALAELRK
eukprot:TRINITY_DN1265_c0_g2_i2.p2 TRINITY_DN1265_c0_g2~~TRINITY_DN1265_c0_g2_i2.p2  ORF type:complete len:310 (+),score=88.56 TRINITY_DN1265_c0_g2_i2:919-1848(+)